MRFFLATENLEAEQLIPPQAPDNSGIAVNYIDAYIRPLNVTLENGAKVTCRRKGLQIMLTVGDQTGEAIIRRADHGPDVRSMLRKAMETAAAKIGVTLIVSEQSIYLEM